MVWSHLLQLLVWCSPVGVVSLLPALPRAAPRVADGRPGAMRTLAADTAAIRLLSRRYAADNDDDDEKIINIEDLP